MNEPDKYAAVRLRYDLLAENYRQRWSRDTPGAERELCEMGALWDEMTRLTEVANERERNR